MSKIKKNLGYQTVYQILTTILPFITSPYLSRVLGAEQLGISSYTTSVAAYFVLFAMLGTINYGTRSIAACREDKEKRSETFWGIYTLQASLAFLSSIAYAGYLLFLCRENVLISVIQGISVLACFLDISWLFFGLEKFKITVTRSLVVKLLSVAAILLLVKKPEDTWLYILILTSSTFLSQLLLWPYARKEIDYKRPNRKDVLAHLRPNLMLFLPLLAMSVYHIMDKTMLGMLSTYEESGFYYNADKIVNITVGVISGFSTVMLPRMTSLISAGETEQADNLFRTSLEGTVFAGTAMACGIAAIAREFEPLFFGPGYEACILLTIMLAPVLIIKSFSFTARYQYLIPHHKEKAYIASVVSGACVNLVINLLLIPSMGAAGAVIGTLAAELTACVWQFVVIRNMIRLRKTLLHCLLYFLFGIAMFFAVRGIARVQTPVVIQLIMEIAGGAVCYLLLCGIYWKLSGNQTGQVLFGSLVKKIKNKGEKS